MSKNNEPISFITYQEQKGYVISKEAEDFLKDQNTILGVISVVGKYRTGKSFFINRVLLNQINKGFAVWSTIKACTKVKQFNIIKM